MALFINNFFSNSRTTYKYQDNVSDKFYAFNKDQVRMVLFRECDFRGRKLLFDSSAIKKVPLDKTTENEKFSEISNGHGYIYLKPPPDFYQLAEMVFGSVAMSFRGTYFKIHSLESPNRLLFSQVFSSPRFNRISVSSRNDQQNFQHSRLDDSGVSSRTSISEHLSVHSTASDTILVCRRPESSPLDVPNSNNISISIPNHLGDSGYGTGRSSTYFSYGTSSTYGSIFSETDGSTKSLSSNNLYKKSLRKASSSLDTSLANSQETPHRHHRSSKLGLILILQLSAGQEEELNQFLMEHITLLEVLLWRARRIIEQAYLQSQNFASLMMEMSNSSAQYLVNLLSGSYLTKNLWLSLSNGCDHSNSISAFNSVPFCNSDSECNIFSFAKFLKMDSFNLKKNFFGENKFVTAERFMQDFCELLEDIDVKNTNFFMSTLLTAVLTYHLGWVNTCLPTATNSTIKKFFNPLWGEIGDLYGAVGYPTKTAQTIITGTHKKELISKILLSMTYFIRCCDIDRRIPIRTHINEENQIVEEICRKYSCIPKENFKKYEDHLMEIMSTNKEFFSKVSPNKLSSQVSKGFSRTQTCVHDLTELASEESDESDKEMSKASKSVVFVLGENEELVGIKKKRPTFLDLSEPSTPTFRDCDFIKNDDNVIKPSTSWSVICDSPNSEKVVEVPYSKKCPRSQSEPPEERKPDLKTSSKYRYAGVKFNLQQYPQILSNYMRSKNVEISNLQFGNKSLKIDELSSLSDTIISKYPEIDDDYEDSEALQTPSNASELEFTYCDNIKQTKESNDLEFKTEHDNTKMKVINLPMPKSIFQKSAISSIKYTSSLMRSVTDEYIPNMVLQGSIMPKKEWEGKLKNDLILANHHSLIDQPVEEAVAIIANTDTWEVQLMSSHNFLIDKGSTGIRIGMSQLVSNMLESLLQMWKLKVPPHFCLMHIEQSLQELCLRSKALSDFLLATEFCNMEQLISTLQLEINDVPLLLAVASIHSPQVTKKYGVSFQ